MTRCAAVLAFLLLAACAGEPSQAVFKNGIGYNPGGPQDMAYGRIGDMYLAANRSTWWQAAYSVDSFTRHHEIWASRAVAGPPESSPWKRADGEPSFAYMPPEGGRYSLDGYLARNPATGLLIARGDTILVERYQYARTDAHVFLSFSMAKTVLAMLVGIAVSEGAIASIDDPAERYVPGLAGSEYGKTPLRHLLTMSSGVYFREVYDGNDDSSKLSRATLLGAGGPEAVTQFNERVAPPGERWYYASSETQVLGLVLRAAIRRPITEYLSEKIWRPMGAEADAHWAIDRTDQEIVYSSFSATLRDYARLGMMLANGGRAGDRQIVPAAWVRAMTTPHFSGQRTGRWYGYGYQTWIFPENDGTFAFLGVRGQAIFVDPSRKLVMVHTAVRPDARDPRGAETTALWRGVKERFDRF